MRINLEIVIGRDPDSDRPSPLAALVPAFMAILPSLFTREPSPMPWAADGPRPAWMPSHECHPGCSPGIHPPRA